MTIYNNSTYDHKSPETIGILLVNLGTPDAPTTSALRQYLGEFLADPRITEMPRWLWWLVLHGIILRIRPSRSAKEYQKVWTELGSPLLEISKTQLQLLQPVVQEHFKTPITVALGMRYGNPSIAAGLEQLRASNAKYILILPLYPQYSATSTGSAFDAVSEVLKSWRWLPDIRFISHYHDHPTYIQALTTHLNKYWDKHGKPDKLLFSFEFYIIII